MKLTYLFHPKDLTFFDISFYHRELVISYQSEFISMWDVDWFCFFYGLFTFLFDIGYLWIIFISQSDFSAIQFPKRSLVASSALLIATYGVFLVIHNFVFHMFHLHLFKIIKNHIPLHILFLSKQFNIYLQKWYIMGFRH